MTSALEPESVHQRLLAATRPALAFAEGCDLSTWRAALEERLHALVGVLPEATDPDIRLEWTIERDEFTEHRYVFTSEPGADVPCHLLVPVGAKKRAPVVVCLQGHSAGMHVSLSRADQHSMEMAIPPGDRDFAVQAVGRGYAALVLEQRCFGERSDMRPDERRQSSMSGCHHATHVASLVGRTMVGERVWDVSRALDTLSEFPDVDITRIACMGHSGGGTVAWYAACLDSRIRVVMSSCSICTYRDSIGQVDHCCDNYLPGVLQSFDMPDLAGLIAPRPLIVVAGRSDSFFPLHGVRDAFATIHAIYDAWGAANRCDLVVGAGGHRFYAEEAWPIFDKLSGWPSS